MNGINVDNQTVLSNIHLEQITGMQFEFTCGFSGTLHDFSLAVWLEIRRVKANSTPIGIN